MIRSKFKYVKNLLIALDLLVLISLFYGFLKVQYKYFYTVKLTILPPLEALLDAHYAAILLF